MHASDVWIEKLATFISQRCALYCLPAVFQRCRRRRRLPPVHRLPVCHLQAILDMNNVANSAAIFYHCRRERCLSDQWPYRRFLSEPGSARYSSTPSLITVWSNYPSIHPSMDDFISNYQTLYNDFFEVYSISLNRWLYHQMFKLSSMTSSLTLRMQITWPVILRSHWSTVNRLTADV